MCISWEIPITCSSRMLAPAKSKRAVRQSQVGDRCQTNLELGTGQDKPSAVIGCHFQMGQLKSSQMRIKKPGFRCEIRVKWLRFSRVRSCTSCQGEGDSGPIELQVNRLDLPQFGYATQVPGSWDKGPLAGSRLPLGGTEVGLGKAMGLITPRLQASDANKTAQIVLCIWGVQ